MAEPAPKPEYKLPDLTVLSPVQQETFNTILKLQGETQAERYYQDALKENQVEIDARNLLEQQRQEEIRRRREAQRLMEKEAAELQEVGVQPGQLDPSGRQIPGISYRGMRDAVYPGQADWNQEEIEEIMLADQIGMAEAKGYDMEKIEYARTIAALPTDVIRDAYLQKRGQKMFGTSTPVQPGIPSGSGRSRNIVPTIATAQGKTEQAPMLVRGEDPQSIIMTQRERVPTEQDMENRKVQAFQKIEAGYVAQGYPTEQEVFENYHDQYKTQFFKSWNITSFDDLTDPKERKGIEAQLENAAQTAARGDKETATYKARQIVYTRAMRPIQVGGYQQEPLFVEGGRLQRNPELVKQMSGPQAMMEALRPQLLQTREEYQEEQFDRADNAKDFQMDVYATAANDGLNLDDPKNIANTEVKMFNQWEENRKKQLRFQLKLNRVVQENWSQEQQEEWIEYEARKELRQYIPTQYTQDWLAKPSMEAFPPIDVAQEIMLFGSEQVMPFIGDVLTERKRGGALVESTGMALVRDINLPFRMIQNPAADLMREGIEATTGVKEEDILNTRGQLYDADTVELTSDVEWGSGVLEAWTKELAVEVATARGLGNDLAAIQMVDDPTKLGDRQDHAFLMGTAAEFFIPYNSLLKPFSAGLKYGGSMVRGGARMMDVAAETRRIQALRNTVPNGSVMDNIAAGGADALKFERWKHLPYTNVEAMGARAGDNMSAVDRAAVLMNRQKGAEQLTQPQFAQARQMLGEGLEPRSRQLFDELTGIDPADPIVVSNRSREINESIETLAKEKGMTGDLARASMIQEGLEGGYRSNKWIDDLLITDPASPASKRAKGFSVDQQGRMQNKAYEHLKKYDAQDYVMLTDRVAAHTDFVNQGNMEIINRGIKAARQDGIPVRGLGSRGDDSLIPLNVPKREYFRKAGTYQGDPELRRIYEKLEGLLPGEDAVGTMGMGEKAMVTRNQLTARESNYITARMVEIEAHKIAKSGRGKLKGKVPGREGRVTKPEDVIKVTQEDTFKRARVPMDRRQPIVDVANTWKDFGKATGNYAVGLMNPALKPAFIVPKLKRWVSGKLPAKWISSSAGQGERLAMGRVARQATEEVARLERSLPIVFRSLKQMADGDSAKALTYGVVWSQFDDVSRIPTMAPEERVAMMQYYLERSKFRTTEDLTASGALDWAMGAGENLFGPKFSTVPADVDDLRLALLNAHENGSSLYDYNTLNRVFSEFLDQRPGLADGMAVTYRNVPGLEKPDLEGVFIGSIADSAAKQRVTAVLRENMGEFPGYQRFMFPDATETRASWVGWVIGDKPLKVATAPAARLKMTEKIAAEMLVTGKTIDNIPPATLNRLWDEVLGPDNPVTRLEDGIPGGAIARDTVPPPSRVPSRLFPEVRVLPEGPQPPLANNVTELTKMLLGDKPHFLSQQMKVMGYAQGIGDTDQIVKHLGATVTKFDNVRLDEVIVRTGFIEAMERGDVVNELRMLTDIQSRLETVAIPLSRPMKRQLSDIASGLNDPKTLQQFGASISQLKRKKPGLVNKIFQNIDDLAGNVRRSWISGQLGGKYVPNAPYHMENIVTAPILAAVTNPSTFNIFSWGRQLKSGTKGRPVASLQRQAMNAPDDYLPGTALTNKEVYDAFLRYNLGTTQSNLQLGDVALNDLRYIMKESKLGIKHKHTGSDNILRQAGENLADGIERWAPGMQGRTSYAMDWALETDYFFRETLFVKSLQEGKGFDEAARLARETFLDYGQLPSAMRRNWMRSALYLSFTYMTMLEMTKAMFKPSALININRFARGHVAMAKYTGSYNYVGDTTLQSMWLSTQEPMFIGEGDDDSKKYKQRAVNTYYRDPWMSGLMTMAQMGHYTYGLTTGQPELTANSTIEDVLDYFYVPVLDTIKELDVDYKKGVPPKQMHQFLTGMYLSGLIPVWSGEGAETYVDRYDLEVKPPSKTTIGAPNYAGWQFRFKTPAGYQRYVIDQTLVTVAGAKRINDDITGALISGGYVPEGTDFTYLENGKPVLMVPEDITEPLEYMLLRKRPVRLPADWEARDRVLRSRMYKLKEYEKTFREED